MRAGKIRAWGVSNFRGWRIAQAVSMARDMNMAGPAICQPYYNLLNRMPEVEVLPACAHYGLGVASYSPIARGVLTGKYRPNVKPPEGSRVARGDKRIAQTEFRVESLQIAQRLGDHAKTRGIDLLQFAWPGYWRTAAFRASLPGRKRLRNGSNTSARSTMSGPAEDEDLVESMVPTGHPSTPGFSDPSYPVIGRQVSV